MATDAALHSEDVLSEKEAWSGGKSPFKASYGKLMMWYFLLSDAFTFAGFLIAYGAMRFSMPTWPVPDFVFSAAPFGIHEAPLIFVTFMTFVLIVSSVTMVRAVQEGHRENKRGIIFWMFLTILGGATFLGSQAWEWTTLIKGEGVTVTQNPFSNHFESGVYVSAEELKNEGFIEKEIHHGDDHSDHGAAESHGDEAGVEDHAHKVNTHYYLRAGEADIPENRYFEKIDHYGKEYAGVEFEENSPYLITYHNEHNSYEYGAYRSNVDGKIRQEIQGPKAFGALFFFITGFHGFHVLSGVAFLIIILVNVASGLYAKRKNGYEMVEKMGLYWHFVDLVWVFVFLVFYLL
jgi:cytochrome c oxidase subunit III